ncbi:hypothetical protein N7452_004911 [Penicillium brevicompactum]|uniref:Uncharacterized protein n=1 Tax=Penicillium brevicompactum TaxID=5074 RepID=A0A9W9QNH4_PENBR|nr:hypothetical protein N7452_004911 [Penicillium brevicompactum]
MGTKASATSEQAERGDEALLCLNFVMNEDRCELESEDGRPIATMNKKTHLALNDLASSVKSIEFKGVTSRRELYQRLSTSSEPFNSKSPKLCWGIQIYVFGARADVAVVGRELSRYRLFLQHPSPSVDDTTYENPHYLNLPGNSLPNGAILPPISSEILDRDTAHTEVAGSINHEVTDVFSAINDLPKQDFLKKVETDGRIQTTLLSHQSEGVSFIIHREQPFAMKSGSLWRQDESLMDRSYYRHKITDAKSRVATDILGGILADEMGLGKTLMMIAAVASSMPDAESHASLMPQNIELGQAAGKIPAKSTLVIVPSPLILDGWVEELERHVVAGSLSYYKYHGVSRSLNTSVCPPYNIVLTTYGTVVADFSRGGGALSKFRWYRLVLDEAHIIRNSSTKTFKAIMDLSAVIRWCMSGTPIQNSLDDLESLVKFLRVPVLDDSSIFRKFITGKTLARIISPKSNYGNLRLLLGSICLRRNISMVTELEASSQVQRPTLSESERRAYKALETACRERITAAISFQRGKGESRIVLTAILLLRIFCNTGVNSTLTLENFLEQSQADEIASLALQGGEDICIECNTDVTLLAHNSTATENQLQDKPTCHQCMSRTSKPTDQTGQPHGVDAGREAANTTQGQEINVSTDSPARTLHNIRASYPPKLMALLDNIKEHYDKERSIVFSYWRRSLDLVGRLFDEQAIAYCRVDGTIHSTQRKKVLQQFHEDPLTRVLLITQGTGSVGLNNLSVASRVHILEPQWNPSIENQAIGRVLRIGQDKKVSVVRYIVQGTIEEASSGAPGNDGV